MQTKSVIAFFISIFFKILYGLFVPVTSSYSFKPLSDHKVIKTGKIFLKPGLFKGGELRPGMRIIQSIKPSIIL
jgi:hypothetical protein